MLIIIIIQFTELKLFSYFLFIIFNSLQAFLLLCFVRKISFTVFCFVKAYLNSDIKFIIIAFINSK